MASRADRRPSARALANESVLTLGRLDLRARVVVDGFLSGLHRSPYHGFSAEFSEYRAYSPGDDLRYLDWKLLGRTDRRYVKRFEDETNLACQILVDASGSMGFGGEGRASKLDHAITLAAALARLLSQQRDAVGLVTFDADFVDVVPARWRPGHLQRLFATLEQTRPGADTGLAEILQRVAAVTRRRGLVVLLSDLLTPTEGLDEAFGQLRARGQDVLLFRVLDPDEVAFPFEDSARFEDLESGRRLYVDPGEARTNYRSRFEAHARELEELALDHGLDGSTWTTDRPLVELLHDVLAARSRRARQVARGGRR